MKKLFVLFLMLIIFNIPVFSWDGYDYDTGNYIEIEKGNLVRAGNDIEIYDYESGEYRDVEVQGMVGNELEVYDYDTGEYRTFEMD